MLNAKLRGNKNLANQLAEQEKLIKHKSKDWHLEGKALLEIKEKELYLGKYRSFEDYCKKKWGFSKRYANMQISAYLFVSCLGTMVPALPANERQARFFTGVNPELQQAAWREALRTAPNGEMTAAHADAVAQKYKTGSHSSGTKTGTRKTEKTTASTFQPSSVLQPQPPVDLSSNQVSEELVQLRRQLEEERNLRIQSQYESLLKDQKIDALSTEFSRLVEQVEENRFQITSLKHQVTNLINQVSQLISQYNQLHFIHTHLTIHAYNLEQAFKRIGIENNLWKDFAVEMWRKSIGVQTEEKVVPFFPHRKDLVQNPEQWRAGR
jgi:hypothetical protein